MTSFKVGCSPLTSEIFAGNVSESGMWSVRKHNVTDTAVGAVAQYLLQKDEEMQFNYKGKKYALRVVELNEEKLKSNDTIEELEQFLMNTQYRLSEDGECLSPVEIV